MKKITKEGDLEKKPKRELTCSNCQCEFSYEKSDTNRKMYYGQALSKNNIPLFVTCPNCELEITVAK